MKMLFIQILVFFGILCGGLQSAMALVEGRQLQVGRYELQYSSEVETIDILEILPGNRFRFIDNGTRKASFFFEGTIAPLVSQGNGKFTTELLVQKDGRFLKDGRVVSRDSSEFNLRLKSMKLTIKEEFMLTEIQMDRWHSYRGNHFWSQSRLADVMWEASVRDFEFRGFSIDY